MGDEWMDGMAWYDIQHNTVQYYTMQCNRIEQIKNIDNFATGCMYVYMYVSENKSIKVFLRGRQTGR